MAFGVSFKFQAEPRPQLVGLDTGYQNVIIKFQFAPKDLTRSSSNNIATVSPHGRFDPISQFVSRDDEVIEFTALFFAETSLDDANRQIEALRRAATPDTFLNRPPIWQFTWGGFISETVMIESVSTSYTQAQSEHFPGLGGITGEDNPLANVNLGGVRLGDVFGTGAKLRSASVRIRLKIYRAAKTRVPRLPSDKPQDTFFHACSAGDTWEKIAAKFYGDPRKGTLLRRHNPESPFLTAGQVVVLPRPERLRGISIVPTSVPLARTPDNEALRKYWFTKLGKNRKSYLLEKA